MVKAKANAPWKYSPNARTCAYCKSQKPGSQPLTLYVKGKAVRGYWHIDCFEKARKELRAKPVKLAKRPFDLRNTSDTDPRVDMLQDGWEEVIFVNADHFRLHRLYGRGHVDRGEVKTWPEARALAQVEVDNGKRVLVYAITLNGRSTVCTDKRWDEFSQLWETYCAGTKGR